MKRGVRRRARLPVVLVVCLALLAGGAGVVFVHANVRLPLRAVAKPELDAAILRGMDYLDRTDAFRRTALEKGPQSIEIWIAKRIWITSSTRVWRRTCASAGRRWRARGSPP